MKMPFQLFPTMITACTDALGHSAVQALFKEEFDLVMLYMSLTDCFLSFVHKLKVRLLTVNTPIS